MYYNYNYYIYIYIYAYNYINPLISQCLNLLTTISTITNNQQIFKDDVRPSNCSTPHYVDGMAFHWYNGNEDRLLDGTYGYSAIKKTHRLMNQYQKASIASSNSLADSPILLATEGCNCPSRRGDTIHDQSSSFSSKLSWLRAERISHDIMFDLLSFGQGWIDWNLIVDSDGH